MRPRCAGSCVVDSTDYIMSRLKSGRTSTLASKTDGNPAAMNSSIRRAAAT